MRTVFCGKKLVDKHKDRQRFFFKLFDVYSNNPSGNGYMIGGLDIWNLLMKGIVTWGAPLESY